MRYEIIVTDTFGGELNYCWVKSATIEVPDDASDITLVKRAKKAVGYSGVRMAKKHGGIYKVAGACIAMVIDPIY
jgi:hypothetical protein